MHARQRWMAVALVAGCLTLFGCTDPPKAAVKRQGPTKLEAIDGTKLKKITLTEDAAKRIGIEMSAITVEGTVRSVPYAAVVYDEAGKTWAYTSPAPFTYVRTEVVISTIAGDKALLTSGPDAGTEVVSVGTAELWGAEQGLGY